MSGNTIDKHDANGAKALAITFGLIILFVIVVGALKQLNGGKPFFGNADDAAAAPSAAPAATFSLDYSAGERAGDDFGYSWAEGAGHPRSDLMETIARRQWEANGRSYSPQRWQDGWLVGFEKGFNRQKTGVAKR